MKIYPRISAGVFTLCLPMLAAAQAADGGLIPAKPSSPQLHYPSAFADYKAWHEVGPGDWRTVNDTVRDAAANAGGHAGHGAASVPAAADTPKPHGMHMPHGSGQPSHGGMK